MLGGGIVGDTEPVHDDASLLNRTIIVHCAKNLSRRRASEVRLPFMLVRALQRRRAHDGVDASTAGPRKFAM